MKPYDHAIANFFKKCEFKEINAARMRNPIVYEMSFDSLRQRSSVIIKAGHTVNAISYRMIVKGF